MARGVLPPSSSQILAALRDADWLDARRATAWTWLLLTVSLAAAVAWAALSHGLLDAAGKPLGTDFVSFYTASELVLSGRPAAAYDVAAHGRAQAALLGREIGYFAFFYPPTFLLVCSPLAALPYPPALLAWLAATGAGYAAAVRSWLGRAWPRRGLGWAAAAAFPAVLLNVGHGQNAFLSAALLGFGALWLDRRPWLAGVCLGLLSYKPHLGVLLPVALAAAGRWRTVASAAATVAAFALASAAVLGSDTWRAFAASAPLARATLEQGLVDPGKMQSVFAAVRVLGGGAPLAYAAHAVTALAVAAAVAAAVWRRRAGAAEPPLLVMAALLGSPFILDYDLLLLIFPLAWLLREGLRDGFAPWEKLGLLTGFVLPAVARTLAVGAHLPVTPLVLGGVLVLVLRRAGRVRGAAGRRAASADQGEGAAEQALQLGREAPLQLGAELLRAEPLAVDDDRRAGLVSSFHPDVLPRAPLHAG